MKRCNKCGWGLEDNQFVCPRCWSDKTGQKPIDVPDAEEISLEYHREDMKEYARKRREG